MANTYSFHCNCQIQYKDGRKAEEKIIYNTPYGLGDINLLTRFLFTRKYQKKVWEDLRYHPDVKDFTIIDSFFSFDLQ